MPATGTTFELVDWRAERARRGEMDCKFRCPACGHIQTANDFVAAGADFTRSATECIGRVDSKLGGCDWAAFGLFDICSVHVELSEGKLVPVFAFADDGPDALPRTDQPNTEDS